MSLLESLIASDYKESSNYNDSLGYMGRNISLICYPPLLSMIYTQGPSEHQKPKNEENTVLYLERHTVEKSYSAPTATAQGST
jgi:hypothetical protein